MSRRGLLRRFCARWGLIARRLRSWCEVVRACRSVPSVALFCGFRDSPVLDDRRQRQGELKSFFFFFQGGQVRIRNRPSIRTAINF
jgi:hypothetical protein